ncbi:MAG: hypothetical protein DSZ28_03365 [Thiothrix sp.]|nr:MAG: hypothetical protein DSZ28_03365 [Thiothrix sp.]
MLYETIQNIFEYLSGEWMLTKCGKANGGTIILLRSSFVTVLITGSIAICSCIFDGSEIQAIGIKSTGAIFAVVYAALYSRFASQWSYLSNLYNSIKQTEVNNNGRTKKSRSMAEWKAGFMEDAENLHMAGKSSFSPIIKSWGGHKKVKDAFIKNASNKGEDRYEKLMDTATKSCKSLN